MDRFSVYDKQTGQSCFAWIDSDGSGEYMYVMPENGGSLTIFSSVPQFWEKFQKEPLEFASKV